MKGKRNPFASALRSPLFRKRVVPVKKGKGAAPYSRKGYKLSLDMANGTDSKTVREPKALLEYLSNQHLGRWRDGYRL